MPRRRSNRRPCRRAGSRPVQLQQLEPRHLLAAALPSGATPLNTAEVLLGTVGVTPVLFESTGDKQTQNWSFQEIQETLVKVDEGVNWWTRTLDKLDTAHTIDFVIDDSFAVDPVETTYEPIENSSSIFNEYVGAFLTSQGHGDAPSIERAVQLFNHDQRLKLGTDWAFTIFIIDSSDDTDGLFTSGGQFRGAFAYPGGLFVVTPSTRPASTFAHEMGHIFWARDEYPGGGSYTDTRGYYNAQLLNADDNPAEDFVHQISIMRGGVPLSEAYRAETSPASTLAFVGWQDSDGDGIFDFADVPLNLDVIGYFDAATSKFHLSGSASAVPLQNQNFSGVQSDITLNRISELQYRLDDGPWTTAFSPDQQSVEFKLAVPITDDFQTIQWRAIDQNLGITSEIVSATQTIHAHSQSSLNGFAFFDENQNGIRDAGETLMTDVRVEIRQQDGAALFGGQSAASDFDADQIILETEDVELSADGLLVNRLIRASDSVDAGNQRVFQSFNSNSDQWQEGWTDRNVFVAKFDQVVADVELSVTGLNDGSYARLEAYDSNDRMIKRITSELIPAGDHQTLSVGDPQARIAKIRAFGHAETSIAIDNIRFGYADTIVTDETGGWKIANFPDGDYQVDLTSSTLIHQFAEPIVQISVAGGTSQTIVSAASRVTSARHKVALPEDVSDDGKVTSRDALLVINDLARHGARVLGPDESLGDFIDVNDDGSVTALDALLVINSLDRQQNSEAEFVTRVETNVPREPISAEPVDLVDRQPAATELDRATASDAVIGNWTNAPVTGLALLSQGSFNSDDDGAEPESVAFLIDRLSQPTKTAKTWGSNPPDGEVESPENDVKTEINTEKPNHQMDSQTLQSTQMHWNYWNL